MFIYHSTKNGKAKVYDVRRATILLMLIFSLLAGSAAKAQQTHTQQSNFYAITGNGLTDTSWLFGTYHLVKSSYLGEVPAVVDAFNKAKAVAVELVLDSSKAVAAVSMGLLKGKTLSGLLDKPFKDSLEKELSNTLGFGIAQVNQMKPLNVAITLSMVYLLADTRSPLHKYTGSLVDRYFAEAGKRAGKNITEFETIEEQMSILYNSATDEQQAEQLKFFLRNKTTMASQGNELLAYWFRHDLGNMYSVSEKGLALFGNEQDFLNKRNDQWMKMLPGLLKKESQFIAVGALHLAGPSGLVKQLQDLGYQLTPIKL